jgi:hypothetical protein
MQLDAVGGHLSVFSNRRRDPLKIKVHHIPDLRKRLRLWQAEGLCMPVSFLG